MKCSFLSSSSSLCPNPGACRHGHAKPYRLSIISNAREKLEMWHLVSSMDKCKKIVLVDIMKCSLMNIVRIECHLMRVNVVKFHLAVASFAACDITSVIHSVLV